jgi:DDE family transposase
MKGADGFVQGYNAQAAVEPDLQLIVGQTVTQATNDKEQLMPMVEVIERQSGQRPEEILADSGYCSEKNLEALESASRPEQRMEGYIATERQKHDEYRESEDDCQRVGHYNLNKFLLLGATCTLFGPRATLTGAAKSRERKKAWRKRRSHPKMLLK